MNAVRPPSWELKRRTGPGSYRLYAHGYWKPLTLTVFTRRGVYTLIGKKKIEAQWAKADMNHLLELAGATDQDETYTHTLKQYPPETPPAHHHDGTE